MEKTMSDSTKDIQGQAEKILLMQVGLTETEAAIYLAGTGSDSITVQEIGKATAIKRPTIYHALRTLTEKGLATEHQIEGKTHIRMQAPAQLLGWIERQKDELEKKEDAVKEIVSQLAARAQQSTSTDTQVMHYVDAKSVQAVFDLAFYARGKRCVLVFPSHEFLEQFDAGGARMRAARERGIDVCLEIRKHIDSALVIYDDTLVLIPAYPSDSATVITSPELSAALSGLF